MTPRVKRTLLFLLILVLAVFFYGAFGRNTLLLSLADETVTVTGPEDSSFSVPYGEIALMELREDFDPGVSVDGGLKNNIRYGLWHNEELQNYQLFASDKIGVVILLRTTGGDVLVFNYESEDTTRSYYGSFTEFLAQQGYAVTAAPAA